MVVAALRDADLMLMCSQIECSPVVLFEAAAAGLPFIAVDVGNSVEIIDWTRGGILAESTRTRRGIVHANTEAVASGIDLLWLSASKRQRLGEAGAHAWRSKFTWEVIASDYGALYERLVK
jgi:glycosyltransferase involved in cell wall biosynthesis